MTPHEVLADARRERLLIEQGWRKTRKSGFCVRCGWPFLPDTLVLAERCVGWIGQCCAPNLGR